MAATTTLPANYRHQATVDLSKSRKAVGGAIVSGMVLLLAVGWLLLQFTDLVRPSALEGTSLHDILTTTSGGTTSLTVPFPLIVGGVAAFLLVMLTHELVHGLFYWCFAGQRPKFAIKGPYVYVAAPPEVYFPRDQYLIVGVAPFVLLTLLGLLLIAIAPLVVVPTLIFFVVFNAAGAAGDLLMCGWLLSYSSDTLMQDRETSVVVYGPERSQKGPTAVGG
jgi:hypothetical protein